MSVEKLRIIHKNNLKVYHRKNNHWTNCPSDELSFGPIVPRTNCPSDELSLGPIVLRTNCLSGQLSFGRIVFGPIVLGRVVLGPIVFGPIVLSPSERQSLAKLFCTAMFFAQQCNLISSYASMEMSEFNWYQKQEMSEF